MIFFKQMAVLKHNIDFCMQVDCSGGTKTPAGEARQSRPHRHEVSRRLGDRPKVREVPGTKINNHV